ncbi:MAG: carbohydrate ABC transporter permease [Christensenellales bacterium]|jgi:putative aldouronate transport system permease protein
MIRDKSLSSKVMDIIVHMTMIIVVLITLVPVLHVISISFSSSDAVNRGDVTLWPVEFSVQAYKIIWNAGTVPNSFMNSVKYTALGTVINVIMTIMLAYPLSKKDLTFRPFYTILIMITMFFGGGLIPSFLLVKNLNLYDTVWAITLPGAISTWNMIIMRTFFQSIPYELEESALLDGANDFQVLFKIVIPLSMASIATISLFYAVGHWNSWFGPMIYFKRAKDHPLQVILRAIVIENQMADELLEQGQAAAAEEMSRAVTSNSIKYATLVISMAPMMLIYPFIQKYFVKGVMIGSIKG